MKIEITEKQIDDATVLLRGTRLGMVNHKKEDIKLYGIVSTNLQLKAVDYLPTFATDGSYLYFNPLFVLGLEQKQLDKLVLESRQSPFWNQESEDKFKLMYSKKSQSFLQFGFVHEIGHCLHDHFVRVGTRDKQLFNQAADYRINADAAKLIYGSYAAAMKAEPVFKLLCFDEKYVPESWFSEKIYEDLLQQQQQNKGKEGQPLDDHMYGSDGNMGGSNKPSDLERYIRDVLGLPDKPMEGSEESKDSANGSNPDSSVELNNSRLRDAFVKTAKEIGKGCGGSLLEKLKAQKPVINWKRILRKTLTGLVKSEKDPKKLCRNIHGLTNFMHQNNMLDSRLGLYKAGKKPEPMARAFVFYDMSGSIGNRERTMMLSETLGIMDMYKSFELTVGCWDTQFYQDSLRVYTKKNKRESSDYEFVGGGGTAPDCLLPFLKSQKLKKSDRIVIFTDCYFNLNKEQWKQFEKQVIIVSTERNMEHVFGDLSFKYIEYDRYAE